VVVVLDLRPDRERDPIRNNAKLILQKSAIDAFGPFQWIEDTRGDGWRYITRAQTNAKAIGELLVGCSWKAMKKIHIEVISVLTKVGADAVIVRPVGLKVSVRLISEPTSPACAEIAPGDIGGFVGDERSGRVVG